MQINIRGVGNYLTSSKSRHRQLTNWVEEAVGNAFDGGDYAESVAVKSVSMAMSASWNVAKPGHHPFDERMDLPIPKPSCIFVLFCKACASMSRNSVLMNELVLAIDGTAVVSETIPKCSGLNQFYRGSWSILIQREGNHENNHS